MSTKTKLISTLVSLVCVMSVMAIGVFAATSTTLNVSNQVSFNGSAQLYTSVTGTVTDEKATDYSSANYSAKTYSEADPVASKETAVDLAAWDAIPAVVLASDNTYYFYTFTIKNDSVGAIKVQFSQPGAIDNVTMSISQDTHDGTALNFATDITIAKDTTSTICVKFAIDDVNAAGFEATAVNFSISFAQ